MSDPTLPQVIVGVATIITRDERVLLIRRKSVHGEGSWSTPGGRMEFKESVEQCAARESLEETGLVVTGIHFVALTDDFFPEHNRHYLSVWMRGTAAEGEPTLAAPCESDAIAWFAWDHLPETLFMPFKKILNGECLPPGALSTQ